MQLKGRLKFKIFHQFSRNTLDFEISEQLPPHKKPLSFLERKNSVTGPGEAGAGRAVSMTLRPAALPSCGSRGPFFSQTSFDFSCQLRLLRLTFTFSFARESPEMNVLDTLGH